MFVSGKAYISERLVFIARDRLNKRGHRTLCDSQIEIDIM